MSNNKDGIVLDNSWYGLERSRNIIRENIINNNNNGISLINFGGTIIHLNNFIDNSNSVYSSDSTNIWNSTSKITYTYKGKTYENYLGNYWDDYTDVDTDNDGIWDHPRSIDSDQDYHPLVEPFENYEEKWSFAIITDLHIGRGYPDYGGKGVDKEDKMMEGQDYYLTERLKKAVEWINENQSNYNIKFVIVLGDISDSGEYSELAKAKDILGKLDVPYVPVIGNHEIWAYTDDEENENMCYFEEVFGDQFRKLKTNPNFDLRLQSEPLDSNPTYLMNYNFTYKSINFIVLDWTSRTHAGWSCPGVNADAETHLLTLKWLEKCLNEHKGEPIILISHHPMTTCRFRSKDAFNKSEFREVCKVIKNSGRNGILDFAGHIHGCNIASCGDWGFIPLKHNLFKDANREYPYEDIGVTIRSITTEALMVGKNENRTGGVKGIIRIVNISSENVYSEAERAEGEFLSLNPYLYLKSSKEMEAERPVNFKFYPFYSWKGKTLYYVVDWGDNTSIEEHTVPTSPIGGDITEDLRHTYDRAGNYTINVTIMDIDNPSHREWITLNITVKEKGETKVPHKIMVPECLLATLWNGADVTENPQNTPEWLLLTKTALEEKPIATFFVHFENATSDINLSDLIADVNLTERKSIIYMPSWPSVIEPSKILYIPSTGKGAVYICKNATSLEEVTPENAEVVINVGETKDGMAVVTTLYNDAEYYIVFNVTGTGSGEFTPTENIFDTGSPPNPYPSIMGNHTGIIKPNHTVIATKLYTYPCVGTGGHTGYAHIGNKTWNATATWEGYAGDWHNITFDKTVVLLAGEAYNYTLRTGSYPQIIHESPFNATGGEITCTKFTDANGKVYYDWIPAIRLE